MSSLRAKLECKNLHQYLSGLPPAILDSLYEHPATCMAVFRELPDLAKHYVMRILFVEQPISMQAAASWVTKDAMDEHKEAVTVLCDLRVWVQISLQGGLPAYNLSSTFRNNLKKALIVGGQVWPTTANLGPDKHAKDAEALDKYSSERWEVILHYLVGSQSAAVSGDIKELMLQSGLMRLCDDDGREAPFITAKGFQFLLMDTPSQVWFFILEYLHWIRDRGMNLVPILRFLFEMSFTTLEMDLPTDGRDEHVLQCLQHLREMGLVFQRKRTSRRFYPTRLAVNLANGLSQTSVSTNKKGFIVAETNYRIYAYTGSDLQYAILSLFCDLLYRFPNVCVGQLTRESVQIAIANGISAEQILHYIRSNAHPDMLKNTPILAPTLEDQIRLWEMERDRLIYQEGVLYNQFLTQHDFEVLRNYAQELQALVWQNEAKRYMVVNRFAHDQVKKYWKKYKKESENGT